MGGGRRLVPGIAIVVAVAVSTAVAAPLDHEPPPPAITIETGRASWYGAAHQGRWTASGERFDMRALTAAHRTLPLGTRVRVVNLDNGRWVDVRVNDRGPAIPARIIDLSYAAARALGAVHAGVVPVRVLARRWTVDVGGPEMAPHTPRRSEAPRQSRGAPR